MVTSIASSYSSSFNLPLPLLLLVVVVGVVVFGPTSQKEAGLTEARRHRGGGGAHHHDHDLHHEHMRLIAQQQQQQAALGGLPGVVPLAPNGILHPNGGYVNSYHASGVMIDPRTAAPIAPGAAVPLGGFPPSQVMMGYPPSAQIAQPYHHYMHHLSHSFPSYHHHHVLGAGAVGYGGAYPGYGIAGGSGYYNPALLQSTFQQKGKNASVLYNGASVASPSAAIIPQVPTIAAMPMLASPGVPPAITSTTTTLPPIMSSSSSSMIPYSGAQAGGGIAAASPFGIGLTSATPGGFIAGNGMPFNGTTASQQQFSQQQQMQNQLGSDGSVASSPSSSSAATMSSVGAADQSMVSSN